MLPDSVALPDTVKSPVTNMPVFVTVITLPVALATAMVMLALLVGITTLLAPLVI